MKKFYYPLTAFFIIAADQLSKYFVRMHMQPGDRIPLIGGWMSFLYVQNTGTAFSMFAGNRFVTVILTSLLIIACAVYAAVLVRKGRVAVPFLLTCIAAGGISNMIDRLALGFVTDMISCGSFAVFNVADMFITCGCILLMITVITAYKKGEEL
ncbi:MAG: signal peptidase II [Mogibacterium sp.]|nr:signal peptidase II [Mogibacterium sp.]